MKKPEGHKHWLFMSRFDLGSLQVVHDESELQVSHSFLHPKHKPVNESTPSWHVQLLFITTADRSMQDRQLELSGPKHSEQLGSHAVQGIVELPKKPLLQQTLESLPSIYPESH
jgi:hypothetical protein